MPKRKRLDFSGVAEPMHIGATARDILHKTVDDGVSDLDMAKQIRLDRIEPDPEQPRKHFDDQSLRDLAQSIRVQGVLQPIVVQWVAERECFRIISGERRWRATHLAAELQARDPGDAMRRDLGRIPAIIQNPGAIDRYLQQIYENEQRQDYSDVERAFAYERLKEFLDLTWEDLAERFGLSKGRVHQIRRTKNRLAPAVQRDITSGRLSGTHGLHLATLPRDAQEAVATAARERQLSAQQTQAMVQQVREALGAQQRGRPAGEDAVGAGRTTPGDTEQATTLTTPAPADHENAAGGDALSAAIEQAVGAVTAPRTRVRRAHDPELDGTLAAIRQLASRAVAVPSSRADRVKLAHALDELTAWTEALRTVLGRV